jgi:hypothetical protein
MYALPPEADMLIASINVRYVPKADIDKADIDKAALV